MLDPLQPLEYETGLFGASTYQTHVFDLFCFVLSTLLEIETRRQLYNTDFIHQSRRASFMLRPWGWYSRISMRMDFYGCSEGKTR